MAGFGLSATTPEATAAAAAAAAAATGTAAAGSTGAAAAGGGATGAAAVAAGGSTGGVVAGPVIGSTNPPITGDVVDTSGAVTGAAYRTAAAQMSKAAGIDYRYGPTSSFYGIGAASTTLPDRSGRTQIAGIPYFYQLGTYSSNPGSYSNNQANMLFVADNTAARVGVTDLQITGYQYGTFAQFPQLPWQIAASTGGGIDDRNVMSYKTAGVVSGDPVAMGRCGGRPGFCAQSVIAYQNGVIATAGSNTASNLTYVKLPADKVPTGVAMTNQSEFALVTVWDTTNLKGQVAVIALAGLCDNCSPTRPAGGGQRLGDNQPYSSYYDWWHEWMAPYPGLPNMGNTAFMKILGYVDLPGMNAPTEIAVTNGMDQFQTILVGGEFMGENLPLTTESNRQSFASGGSNANRYAKAGVAVVISKSEKKAAFIDLKPLFSYYNSVYFGGSQSTFSSTMANFGTADGQWPFAFSVNGTQRPTVIKTVTLDGTPTAVRTTLWGANQRAWIATQEGTLRIFGLGGYVSGASANPADIAQRGTVPIAKNVTGLAMSKGEPSSASVDSVNGQVIAVSRGERKIQWVRFGTADTGSVTRTLQDSRLQDPIAIEDADNFATTTSVLSVTDYTGKAIINYRYGPVIFADGGACPAPSGCGVLNGAVAEFGGSLAVQGKPFHVSTTNVP